MENTEMKELEDLKEKIKCLPESESRDADKLYTEAQQCLVKRLEILVASGFMESHDLTDISYKLEVQGDSKLSVWRGEIIETIDMCLKKYSDFERMKKAAPKQYRR